VHALRRKLGSLGWRRIAQSACKTLGSAAFMGTVVWAVARRFIPTEGGTFTELVTGLVACVMIGLIVFGACSYFIKSPEFTNVVAEVKKGIGKK
jgi:peptidoglycan biosynthesis protein MviN/MurJ (putative lipid II flippase)